MSFNVCVCVYLQNFGHGGFRLRPENTEGGESAETPETCVRNPQ